MSKKSVIVFEGIEGSGKSFHISNVSRFLKRTKIDHIKIREPGGTLNAEKIRKLILNNKSSFSRSTDLLLYFAARSENMNLLRKYYKKKIILIDRFIDSTVAYQHYGFGLEIRIINEINNYLLGKFKVVYDEELVGEYDLLAAKNVDKVNIFTRLIRSLNYLIWGDV